MLLAAMPGGLVAGEKAAPKDAPKAAAAPISEAPAAAKAENPAPKSPAGPSPRIPDDKNTCIACHSSPDWAETLEGEKVRLAVAVSAVAADIHWQKGLRCQDCHGGDPTQEDYAPAHTGNGGLRSLKHADVPAFCGECHANIDYMRRYLPSPRTDQLAEYWTSGHGQKLKAAGDDVAVATCISCHDKPHGSGLKPKQHGIRAVADLESPVYRTRLANTCAKCHSNEKLMKDRTYHGRPLGYNQNESWRQSVHGKALLEKGDLSAPTCNHCHGNHGAVPPQVDSVANACGTCHGREAKLFADTKMKHGFEQARLPGCVTCHATRRPSGPDNHLIRVPDDNLLGMQEGAVCIECHNEQQPKYGATVAGAKAAQDLRSGLDTLKAGIDHARETLEAADHLGMEVSKPRFELRKATDALTSARVQIHSFDPKPAEKALADGQGVLSEVQAAADKALYEHHARRVWLGLSLVPILAVVLLLVFYIRALPLRGGDKDLTPVDWETPGSR
jgi:hypothetical protein